MNRAEKNLREQYLELTDEQEKADFLWRHRIGGAALALSPGQYPAVEPRHELCPFCRGHGVPHKEPDYQFSIMCSQCSRKTRPSWSTMAAWRDWDDGKIDGLGQLSLFDL